MICPITPRKRGTFPDFADKRIETNVSPCDKLIMQTIDSLSINTIRTLSMDAVQQANSGHPGTPMALAPVAYVLWQEFLAFDPEDPIWPNRDRFVLSAGHASTLLYSLLHLTGVKAVNRKYELLASFLSPWMT
jgi:transketolase